MNSHKKLRFTFENADGGQEVESLWVLEREGGYEIDNIPFYVNDVACGDLVAARSDDEGQLWFSHLIQASRHSTLRLWFAREDDVEPVREHLWDLKCASEISDIRRLVAVDVPPTVGYETVKLFLENGKQEGRFEYEEACLGFLEPKV